MLGLVDGSSVTKGGAWKMLGTSEGVPVGPAVGLSLSFTAVGSMELSVGAFGADGPLAGMSVEELAFSVGGSE